MIIFLGAIIKSQYLFVGSFIVNHASPIILECNVGRNVQLSMSVITGWPPSCTIKMLLSHQLTHQLIFTLAAQTPAMLNGLSVTWWRPQAKSPLVHLWPLDSPAEGRKKGRDYQMAMRDAGGSLVRKLFREKLWIESRNGDRKWIFSWEKPGPWVWY